MPVALDLNEAQAWQLLAITGGVPLQLFGEWEGARWHVLSAWLADEQQALSLVWQREEHA